jgi:CMP-N,N'-diacetyllegionaminic acid synthase
VRTLAIIPARAGSRRLTGKNMRLLGGRPLVGRAIDAARGSSRLSRIVVSSDDPAVLAFAASVEPGLALPRPPELATDDAPAIAYVRHALATLEAAGQPRFDAVAIVQPSSPFTLAADIDATLDLLERSGAESAVTVMRVSHDTHPAKLKTLDGDRLMPYLEEESGRMSADALPDVYVRNCSVYATRRAAIDRGEIVTADCRGVVMPRERSVDINDAFDFAFAEFLAQRRTAE